MVSGEYAVLAGAPALVMAIDRRVHVRIEVTGDTWIFDSLGFAGKSEHSADALRRSPRLPASDPAGMAQQILSVARFDRLPDGLRITIDSRAAYDGARKLGIGSSAAVCVALTAAFAAFGSGASVIDIAQQAHRNFQGGRGSGLDVAAAYSGGLIEFTSGAARPRSWPRGVHYRLIWTGTSASTTDHLARFERGSARVPEFDALKSTARAVARASDARFVRELARFTQALVAFDGAAGLGIYSPAHAAIAALANDNSVVYKPCGAGGGDIGAAISDDPEALSTFAAAVTAAGFRPIDMELDQHGILVDIAG